MKRQDIPVFCFLGAVSAVGVYALWARTQRVVPLPLPATAAVAREDEVEGRLLTGAVETYLRRTQPAMGAVEAFNPRIDGSWGYAYARTESRELGFVHVLLRRGAKGWQVVTFGATLEGQGKKYKVPPHLLSQWYLE